MKEDKKLHKRTMFLAIVAFLFVLSLTFYSFAFYSFSSKGVSENKIESCSLDMDVLDGNSFQLVSTYPIEDSEAINFDPYTVTVRNNNNKCTNIHYYINAVNYCNECTLDKNGNCVVADKTINCNSNYRINPQVIKYMITNRTTGESIIGTNPESMNFLGNFTDNSIDTYDIRLWISNTATNNDIYVYDQNGHELLDGNGNIVTKSYLSYFEVRVTSE